MVGLPGAICSVYNGYPVNLIFHSLETLQNRSKVRFQIRVDHAIKDTLGGKGTGVDPSHPCLKMVR